MSKYDPPPIGATVRHTTRWTDGVTATFEGPVRGHRGDGFHIGSDESGWVCALRHSVDHDQPRRP